MTDDPLAAPLPEPVSPDTLNDVLNHPCNLMIAVLRGPTKDNPNYTCFKYLGHPLVEGMTQRDLASKSEGYALQSGFFFSLAALTYAQHVRNLREWFKARVGNRAAPDESDKKAVTDLLNSTHGSFAHGVSATLGYVRLHGPTGVNFVIDRRQGQILVTIVPTPQMLETFLTSPPEAGAIRVFFRGP